LSRRDDALAIFREALAALDPRRLVREALAPGRRAELWAVGKAAHAMAEGARDAGSVVRALVVGKEEAGHPSPDARSLAAGRALLARAAALGPDDEVVLALSGGASALAVAPAWGLSLDDKVAATRAVAAAGAPIQALNALRKHVSELKGGRLAAATRARITALVLSDVVGDDPSVVGSGPVAPDPTTFADALAVARGVPAAVTRALEAGARGELPETPKLPFAHVALRVLAGPDDLARAAAAAAARRGYRATVETRVASPVEELAARLAARAASQGPGEAFVASGEPTISLPPHPGRGGRAQHTALLAAASLRGDAVVLCAASDGDDGAGGGAGGLVDAGTAGRVDVAAAAAAYESAEALAAAGDQIVTGMTGNNLCDLFIVLT
jgi:glycerate 2-kinase